MSYLIKSIVIVIVSAGLASLVLSGAAHAQSAGVQYSGADLRGEDIGLRAGVGLTVPFGQVGPKAKQDKARLSFGFAVDRTWTSPRTGLRERTQLNLLDFGLYEDATPSLQLTGQELYGPLFDLRYHAEGDPRPTGLENPDLRDRSGAGITVIAIGGAALAYLLISESNDKISDCSEAIAGDNRC